MNKGDQWLNGRVNVNSAKSFRLTIEGIRGSGYLSDLAIDDIDFTTRPCSRIPYEASPDPSLLSTTQEPISTRTFKPTTPLDCTFEQSMCQWSASGSFNWTRVQGIQGSILSGPIESDHTLGNPEGWYLFADLNNRKLSDLATVKTPKLSLIKCMQFYYYFYANAKFDFNVYVERSDLQYSYPVWSRSGSQSNYWRLAQISVGSILDYYKVSMEISNIVNGGSEDRVAIDDVYFTAGQCKDSSDINEVNYNFN